MKVRQWANEIEMIADSQGLQLQRKSMSRTFLQILMFSRIVDGGQWAAKCFFWLSAALLAVLMISSSDSAQSSPPSAAPILRLETGMHTASINSVGVDSAGRFMVTASDDKTARVWNLATGELLRILRVPVDNGFEGKLYSAAISPDGSTVAVGGWTGGGNYEQNIYLFDRQSGRLIGLLSGFPNVIFHLVFSPDGKYLAATLGSGNLSGNTHVFETRGWQLIGIDDQCLKPAASRGADFDRNNHLVIGCDDQFIRLFTVSESGLKLLAQQKTTGQPLEVKFSPDGSKIAVISRNSINITVLSATDLSLLYTPDVRGATKENWRGVAWSANGEVLYANGRISSGNYTVRLWTNGGRGNYRETDAALNEINDIQPLPGGGVVYAADDPAWGIIDASGKRSRFVVAKTADFRPMPENFRVSQDGSVIDFVTDASGKSPLRFSVPERRLRAATDQTLSPPRVTAVAAARNSLNITDWRNTSEPKLNGDQLYLEENEKSLSLAIAPENEQFVLGSSGYLRWYNDTGSLRWGLEAPGPVWGVNISGDGRLVIAAFGDGTIRWYEKATCKELLAFFLDKNHKRWVMWTPSGYYDASPDAEELIGWHVNNIKDAAPILFYSPDAQELSGRPHINNGRDAAPDFFPVGLFRNLFYRPDVISKILSTADEDRALELANTEAGRKQQPTNVVRQLPPVIEIITPRDGVEVSATAVKIDYSVRAPSGEPVTNIRVLVDGRPVNAERQLERPIAGGTASVTVTIPEKDADISVIAENRFARSVPATVRVKWSGKTAAVAADEFVIKPKLYVLAIGVSKYANPNYTLDFPAKDAEDFAAALLKQKGGLYREVVVKTLTDANATRDNVVDALDWIRTQTTSKDVAMIFFAGHGVNDALNRYYFCPYNFSLDRQSSTGVGMNEIKTTVENIAGKVVLFVDSCHSGNVLGTAKARGNLTDINGFVNELASAENGAIIFAASTGSQVSLEDAAWHNGAFTKALVEGLSGRAEIVGKGKVTVNSLDLYVSERVKELTKGQQTPTTAKPATVPDFPVALKQ